MNDVAPGQEPGESRQTVRNALASVAQTAFSGLMLFVLYRFLLEKIGVEQLGVWALVLASTHISRLSGLGLHSSAVRFVAKYLARGERRTAAHVVETGTLSMALAIGIALLPAAAIIRWVLGRIIEPGALPIALDILPYALVSVWLNAVSGVVQSGLDGCQRADLRSMSSVVTSIVYFIVAVATVPALGLHGLACAQVLQSVLILLINWWKLRRLLPELSIFPRIWKRALFSEMVRYGANFQAEAIFGMLHDPIAKALLSKYGGMATVGYYEMASRMVFQLRSLIGSAFMVLVPVIASAHENTPARVRQLYATSCRALIYVTVPAYGAIIAAAPVISQLWIGRVEPTFVLCTVLLAMGWMVNALNAPAMHANLGIGELWWNTAAAVAIAAFNVMLGIPLGHLFAGPGVVVSWALALAMGSTLIGVAYHRRHRIPLTDWFHPESRAILLAAAAGAGLAVLTYTAAGDSGHAIGGAVAGPIIYALIVSVPLWTHPVRRLLVTVVLQRRQVAHRG